MIPGTGRALTPREAEEMSLEMRVAALPGKIEAVVEAGDAGDRAGVVRALVDVVVSQADVLRSLLGRGAP